MSRDLETALASDAVAPHPAIRQAIMATPYRWRDPETLPTRDWVYGHQLLRGSIALVIAPGATGKTALMTGTALALATGRALLGKTVWGGPKTVWLWNLEDSGDELARGIQAAALHWGISASDIASTDRPRLYVDSGLEGAELKTAHETKDGTRINAPVISALVDQLRDKAIDVLVVDPFVSSHSVPENDNTAIDLVAKQWAKVASITQTAIVLVHHSRKLGLAEAGAESARGASALVAAARSVLAINRMSEEEAAKLGVDGETRRRFVRTYDDKNNRAPPAETSDWFELRSVSLGNGPNGGDSLPVVVPWTPPSAFDGVATYHLRAVQDLIAVGAYRKDPQANGWAGEAVASVLNLDMSRKADKTRAVQLLKTWERNGALKVERRKDESRRERDFYVVGDLVEDCAAPPSKGGAEQGGAVAH